MRRSLMKAMIRVEITVRNPRNLKLKANAIFLVDTGADFPAISRMLMTRLKIETLGQTIFNLANGEDVKLDIAYIYLEFGGERILTMATISEDDECCIDFNVLAALKIHIDTSELKLLKAFKKRFPRTKIAV